MQINKPWLLTHSALADQITILNLTYSGQTLFVGRSWYQRCISFDLLDDICFHLVVTSFNYFPPCPEL